MGLRLPNRPTCIGPEPEAAARPVSYLLFILSASSNLSVSPLYECFKRSSDIEYFLLVLVLLTIKREPPLRADSITRQFRNRLVGVFFFSR